MFTLGCCSARTRIRPMTATACAKKDRVVQLTKTGGLKVYGARSRWWQEFVIDTNNILYEKSLNIKRNTEQRPA